MGAAPPPSHPIVTLATGLALMLETACEEFEALQRLIRGDTRLVHNDGQEDHLGAARARMPLAKSFVFHVVRARRIIRHGAGQLAIDRAERTRFLKATDRVTDVRDVNEHGFDPTTSSRPAMHHHAVESALVDETALVILAAEKVLMGPLNLYTVYLTIDQMRQLAGIASLQRSVPAASSTAGG